MLLALGAVLHHIIDTANLSTQISICFPQNYVFLKLFLFWVTIKLEQINWTEQQLFGNKHYKCVIKQIARWKYDLKQQRRRD